MKELTNPKHKSTAAIIVKKDSFTQDGAKKQDMLERGAILRTESAQREEILRQLESDFVHIREGIVKGAAKIKAEAVEKVSHTPPLKRGESWRGR